ncbi:MAG: hypothetical protein KF901_22225, partial [Myxococcales bacterium]|nr:hypothetical protein [Myxococcales bacterium]
MTRPHTTISTPRPTDALRSLLSLGLVLALGLGCKGDEEQTSAEGGEQTTGGETVSDGTRDPVRPPGSTPPGGDGW